MTGFVLASLLLGATIYEQTFTEANAAYQAGDYAAAVAGYEQLMASDVSDPAVFYNLGNAYVKLGRLGPALANYERTLQLDPSFGGARENLQHALSATQRKLPRPPTGSWREGLLFWDDRAGYGFVWWGAVLFWLLFWVLVSVRLWRRVRYVRPAAAVCLALAVLFALSAWSKAHPAVLAVAATAAVPVRQGVSETEPVHFELLEGDRVRVERRMADWLRVATAGGERGWAKVEDFVLVGPPYEPSGTTDPMATAEPEGAGAP